MPRSATDATRFTSTTPHASAKIQPAGSKRWALPQKNTGPPGETPQQKVRRLRAAADAAKLGEISTFDKIVIRGRVWADRAHRFTALSLIGATFIAGGVTVYALGDMIIYNRRKRAEFYTEQKARYEAAIHVAKAAIESGSATEAQVEFIERDIAQQTRVDAIKANKKGVFKRASEFLFSGLKKEEQSGDSENSEAESSDRGDSSLSQSVKAETTDIKDKAKEAFANEKERQRTGGPLDQLGASAENVTAPPKSGGWTSFMTRRS